VSGVQQYSRPLVPEPEYGTDLHEKPGSEGGAVPAQISRRSVAAHDEVVEPLYWTTKQSLLDAQQ
jgi:hypothetical protein